MCECSSSSMNGAREHGIVASASVARLCLPHDHDHENIANVLASEEGRVRRGNLSAAGSARFMYEWR